MRLKLVNVNLGALLGEWIVAFSNAARKRHIVLTNEISTSDDMTTAVDIDKIERVIFNLISNAFKFTPENGTIKISASRRDHDIIIKVSDTGCGIPPAEINRVFDRFFKTDNVNPEGSGIGLALTKVFVEMHSGSISVDSTEGAGTEFTVVIPVTHVDAAAASVPAVNIIPEEDAAELLSLIHI